MSECVRHAPLIGARQGELTEAEATSLALHLETCARCQAWVKEAAATDGLVGEALLARAAERDFAPFVDQVMARIVTRSRCWRSPRRETSRPCCRRRTVRWCSSPPRRAESVSPERP